MNVTTTRINGLEAIQLESNDLRVVVIPAWGGKIASLYDCRRDREWLHRNPHLPYRLPAYGDNYGRDFDAGGFDECFPNISAGEYPVTPWQGTPLPDHGEVWSLPWQVTEAGDALHLAVHGVRLPYRLEKTLTLAGGCLRCAYRLENPTPFPMAFVWSSHPTFAVQPGMRLHLPATAVRVEGGVGPFPARAGETVAWPMVGGVDRSLLPPRDAGMATKLFALKLDGGAVTLEDPADGARCALHVDPKLVPNVGLWMNFGGWAGISAVPNYYNLAIEPCIGAADSVTDAMSNGTAGWLPAHGERRWWLEFRVG